jgi:hypothetical protein
MRCTKAMHQLQLYLDHQLTLRQTRVLEAHVASCTACREELFLLEAVSRGLDSLKVVPEPADMHEQIMQKVALTTARKQQLLVETQTTRFKLFRPSLGELLAAVVLATMATLLSLLQLPGVHALLPIANGSDPFSLLYTDAVRMLTGIDTNTLSLALWIVGTLLGVVITLMVAGTEIRARWFKAVLARLPVRP